MGFIAHPSNSLECCCTGRWFHVWCLPVLWLVPVAGLWCVVVLRNQHGDANLLAALASLPGLWLIELIPQRRGNLPDALGACIGGMLPMSVVGLFQDLLHVPRRIVLVYIALPIVSFGGLHILWGLFPNAGESIVYLQLFLFHSCMGLYLLSVGSCIVYFLRFVCRAFARVTKSQEL
jgi:hypothetical protein